VRTLRVTGHNMLVRRCVRDGKEFLIGEIPAGVKLNPEAKSLIATFQDVTPVCWATVKCIGPDCGKPMSHERWDRYRLPSDHKGACHIGRGGKKYDVPRGIVNPCRFGDMVLLPPASKHSTMFRGILPGAEQDDSEESYLIISEFDMIAISPRENADG